MNKTYNNPSQQLGKVDKVTFSNVLKKHLEYLKEYQEKAENDQAAFETLQVVKLDLGDFYMLNEKYDDALDYYFQVFNTTKDLFMKNSIFYKQIHFVATKISRIYLITSNFEKGIEFHNETIELLEAIKDSFPNKERAIGIEYIGLAQGYMGLAEYETAETHYLKALKMINDDEQGKLFIAIINKDLAKIYALEDLYDKAEKHFKIAIEILKVLSIDNSSHRAHAIDTRSDYAGLLERSNQNQKAIEVLETNIEDMEKDKTMTNNQKKFYVSHLVRLSKTYNKEKNYQKAIDLYLKVLDIVEEQNKTSKEDFIGSIPDMKNDIANLAMKLKDYTLAEKMHNEVIQFILIQGDKINVAQKAFLAQQYIKLSMVKDLQKQLPVATSYCLDAYKIYDELIKIDRQTYFPGYLDIKNSLSNFYCTSGDSYNSERICLELLEDVKEMPQDTKTTKRFLITIYQRLIKIYTKAKYNDVLLTNYKILMMLYEDVITYNDLKLSVDYLNERFEYSNLLFANKDIDQAISILEKNVEFVDGSNWDQFVKKDITQKIYNRIAYYYLQNKNYEKAMETYLILKDVILELQTFDKKYLLMLCDVQNELANCYIGLGKNDEAENLLVDNVNKVENYQFDDENNRNKVLGSLYFKTARYYFNMKKLGVANNYYLKSKEHLTTLGDANYDNLIKQIDQTLETLEKYFNKK